MQDSFNAKKKLTHRRIFFGDRELHCLCVCISILPWTLHAEIACILLAVWITREFDRDTSYYSIHLIVQCCRILSCKVDYK